MFSILNIYSYNMYFHINTKGDRDKKIGEGSQHLGKVLYGDETRLDI